MKKTITTIVIVFLAHLLGYGQGETLPAEISVSDRFSSPWGKNVEYRYSLKLIGGKYEIIRMFQSEDGIQNKKLESIGFIDAIIIERLIELVHTDQTYEIQFQNFSEVFTHENAIDFINEYGANYWITSDIQEKFLLDNLTKSLDVENNLKSYYRNYDRSGWIDGSSTEIRICFVLNNKQMTVVSRSVLEYALPINVNDRDHFNPELSRLLANIIPSGKTNRQRQLSGDGLFTSVAKKTITNNRRKLDALEVHDYSSEVDSLKDRFVITNLRVVNGLSSTNWHGEKRLNCQLWDTTCIFNLSIMYSSKIENSRVKYPPSIIIGRYEYLVQKLLSVKYFSDFLLENDKRKISIIFDDLSCFTEKTKESFLVDCGNEIDFDNSLFIAVWDENAQLSNWIVLPDGKYILWLELSGKAIIPNDDDFIKCAK